MCVDVLQTYKAAKIVGIDATIYHKTKFASWTREETVWLLRWNNSVGNWGINTWAVEILRYWRYKLFETLIQIFVMFID